MRGMWGEEMAIKTTLGDQGLHRRSDKEPDQARGTVKKPGELDYIDQGPAANEA